ncbi:MAG: flippase-like domain-containing protein [Propionibacteriaceae bacterium]|jgi:uncharacterized protein (TIRG00374 family)|nr:flippase-like domain-containing protein [Propionibacteriaceae bacterium]
MTAHSPAPLIVADDLASLSPVTGPEEDTVTLVAETPQPRVRNAVDIVAAIGCLVLVVLICVGVIYAQHTSEGISADVRGFSLLVRRVLFVPVAVLDFLVLVVPPVAVGLDLLIRRHPLEALQAGIAGLAGLIVNTLALLALTTFAPDVLREGLSVWQGSSFVIAMPFWAAAICSLLTVAVTPAKRVSVRWSWNLLWIVAAITVITSGATLQAMILSLLLGRMTGHIVRYIGGVASQRAQGRTLVEGIRQAGFLPRSLTPIEPGTDDRAPGRQTPQFFGDHRLYVLKTITGATYDVVVLDGDRQVLGFLTRLWRYIRFRGIDGRTTASLRQTAERAALLNYSARSAGVNTPSVLALAEAEDSMLIVREPTTASRTFAELGVEVLEDDLVDDILDAMWHQIRRAHRASIAHRALTADVFRIHFVSDPATGEATRRSEVTVLGWEAGDVASSELARRLDLVQMLVLTCERVGVDQAFAAAERALSDAELAALGPLLQLPALPARARAERARTQEILSQLRLCLARDMPTATVEPVQLTRISVRSIISILLVAIVILVVATTINIDQIIAAVRDSDWRWAVAALLFGGVGLFGAGLTLVAFAPVRLPFGRAVAAQVAAAFVAVAAPAGFGPAAVNLMLLTKRKVPTALAAATVALTQVSQIVVTVVFLLVLTLVTGSGVIGSLTVTPGMLVVAIIVALAVTVVLIVPSTRKWVAARVLPTLQQTWPRFVEVVASPARLAAGIVGNLLITLGYAAAFQASLLAFGQEIPFVTATIVYLLGNTAGAVVPTPGGIGAIEVALSAALVSVGVNAGVATSAVVLFRVVAYWIRIPLGYIAMRVLRRMGEF